MEVDMRHGKARAHAAPIGAAVLVLALAACSGEAMAADVFVNPGGSDSNPCTPAAPCRSFDRAYRVAAPGQVVEVAGGSYSDQSVGVDASKAGAGARVIFVPAAGAAPALQDLAITGSHVEFHSMRFTGFAMREGADDVVFRNVDMAGSFVIRSASNFTWLGGSVGPQQDTSVFISAADGSSTPSRNVTLDGLTFHDFTKVADGAHVDCLAVDDVDGFTVRNSTFRNCEHFDIIFGRDNNSGRAVRNLLIENTTFDCCRSGYYSIGFGDVDGPGLVRHNSANQAFGFLGGTYSGLTIDSNVLPKLSGADCDKARWSYNVIASGNTCGAGDKIAASRFLNAAALDFHLAPGAPAIDAGNPASTLLQDMDGGARIGRPDAGADEFGSVRALPGGHQPPAAVPSPVGRNGGGLLWRSQHGAPRATLDVKSISLRRMLRAGLPMTLTCSERCIGRRLGSDRARSKKGSVKLRIHVSRRVRHRLRRARSLHLSLRVSAADLAGHKTWTKVDLTLKR
jgi:hypothetical protein